MEDILEPSFILDDRIDRMANKFQHKFIRVSTENACRDLQVSLFLVFQTLSGFHCCLRSYYGDLLEF